MRAGVTYGEIMADLLGLGTAFGSTLDFIGGLAANSINKQIANQNLDFQREANAQNLALVRETNAQNIAFQQKENEITRSREDNAVQRAAADMTAAGLSKTLAAGNPASAAAFNAPKAQAGSVKALNNQFKYESALQKLNLGSLMLDMASKQKDLDIKDRVADAQIANMNAVTAGQELSNSTFMEEFNLNKEFKFAQTHYQNVQSAKVEAETDLVKTQGKYAAQKATAEINVLIAQRVKTNAEANVALKNLDKISQEIAESVARTANLDKQGQELAYKITYAELQNKALQHDIDYAEDARLPVGSMLNGTLGSILNSANTLLGLIADKYLGGSVDGVPWKPWSSLGVSVGGGKGYAW